MSDQPNHTGPNENSRASLEKAAMQDVRMQDVHAQLMREKEEPHEGFSPVPIFLMFAFAALCFWGGVYLVHYSGDFKWNAYSPYFKDDGGVVVPVELSLFERGKKVYTRQCVQCHQVEGNGVPGVYPPLGGSSWVTGHPQVVSRILISGLNGPIEVMGNTYNGNMPAFGPTGLNLKPVDIAGVITYIRQEWGNSESDVTEDTINEYMALYASRSTPWQAAELLEDLGPIPEPPAVEEPVEEAEITTEEVATSEEAAH